MNIVPTLFTGRPSEPRIEKEERCYRLLDSLEIGYVRVDHEHADTIEACHEIEKLLGCEKLVVFGDGINDIDLFEDFGELIKLNYNAAGVSGLEFLLEYPKFDAKTPYGVVLRFAQYLLEEIYSSVLDYKAVIDAYWHYIYSPSSDWAKFCKMSIFLLTVRRYIAKSGAKADKSDPNGYYNMLQKSLRDGRFELSAIATTNYNKIIQDILGDCDQVTFLNGSVDSWYDPYLNKIGSKEELDNGEHHIIVPLIFTQSGTKPIPLFVNGITIDL